MKKILNIAIITICMFGFGVNVFAAGTCIDNEQQSGYSQIKSNYEAGISQSKITYPDKQDITLYGKSVSGKKTYANGSEDVNSALSEAVTCSNGENYIKYRQTASGKRDCSNGYWSEDYNVVCTSNSTSSDGSTVVDKSTGKVTSGGTTSSGSSSSNGSGTSTGSGTGSSSSSGSGYNSSSTVNNESTGVNTYFIVLGLVGAISYTFMLCVKKYNLFKNI